MKHSTINLVYIKQLIRCSSSIGSNYIGANENLGKNDFKLRLKVSGKEAKESVFWLQLLIIDNSELEEEKSKLMDEAPRLQKTLSTIISKAQS